MQPAPAGLGGCLLPLHWCPAALVPSPRNGAGRRPLMAPRPWPAAPLLRRVGLTGALLAAAAAAAWALGLLGPPEAPLPSDLRRPWTPAAEVGAVLPSSLPSLPSPAPAAGPSSTARGRALTSPGGERYELLAGGDGLFPLANSSDGNAGGAGGGYDVVVLTTLGDRSAGDMMLCNLLWSVLTHASPERVTVVWSRAGSAADFERIKLLTVQCTAAAHAKVAHLMEPALLYDSDDPDYRHGPSYANALRTQVGRGAPTVLLEGDVALLPGFDARVRRWVACMGPNAAVKLYKATGLDRGFAALDDLVPAAAVPGRLAAEGGRAPGLVQDGLRWALGKVPGRLGRCFGGADGADGGGAEVGVGVGPEMRGSQGVLMGPRFLEAFLGSLAYRVNGGLINGDHLLARFCLSPPAVGRCFTARPSAVQHLGLGSSLFGSGEAADNDRFHRARGVPLGVGTVLNHTAGAALAATRGEDVARAG